MATYVIGDVQGCYDELQKLLEKINYDPAADRLGFVGDLVSRGPQSLATLRFVRSLPDAMVVLGNHDFHCLALGYGVIERDEEHTLQQIVQAPDRDELLSWLRQQPLIIEESSHNCILVHAGIPPQWSIDQAKVYAKEVESCLRGDDFIALLENMYGDEPSRWQEDLTGWDRIRYIINAFTRMRFCTQDGELNLTNKTAVSHDPDHFKPWFEWRHDDRAQICFGHWASLNGHCNNPNIHALDTGCVWGNHLTAFLLQHRRC